MRDLCCPGNSRPMTSSDSALGIVQSFFSAKERHDLDAVARLLADDVVYRFPLPASGEQEYWFVYEGKDETLKYQRACSTASSRSA